MSLAPSLLEKLRCPESHGELVHGRDDDGEFLLCPQSKLRYRVEEGVPVMLVEEAQRLDSDACQALLGIWC